MKRKLYLFDFDGTLTKVDSLFDFLKFSFPTEYNRIFRKHFISFVLSKLKITDTAKAKEAFIADFLQGKSRKEIEQLAQAYFQAKKDVIFHDKAKKYLEEIHNYHDKFIVSASLDIWLEPFADYFGCGLICTQAEYDERDVFTGKFASENCNYQQKKIRIEKEIDLSLYDEILAFGDTKGDAAMLSLATEPHFRFFE